MTKEAMDFFPSVTLKSKTLFLNINKKGCNLADREHQGDGNRRDTEPEHRKNIDFRLEKKFRLPMGKIGLFLDVF